MEFTFWTAAAFVAYVYIGYPMLLGLWARAVRLRDERRTAALRDGHVRRVHGRELPYVSVIIAARNEAKRLPARIANILASDYPADRLQIIVASDGSTDTTPEALTPYIPTVELVQLPASGKALALNAGVAHARHPILVFADARQTFAPDAIRRLVSHFVDRRIGAVSGELQIDAARSTVGDGVFAYWKCEVWLRRREALVGSTIGVTGAIYAMRRDLWQPLPAGTLLDDVLAPMRVVFAGYRVIFDAHAHAYDEAAATASSELRRKVRTLTGNFQLLVTEPRLLVPVLNPVWLQFMSHKVGRLFVPYALVILLATSIALSSRSALYNAACIGQVLFYVLALYGAVLDQRRRPAPAGSGEVYREAA